MLDSGAIGEPFFGRISFRSGYDVFSGQPYLATGKRFIIEDLGIHILDIARFLFGDVADDHARERRAINPAIAGEDVATMLLDHENGATSVVDCSYATKLAVEPFPETLVEIDGSEGTIRLRQGYRLTVTRQGRHERARRLAAAAALGVAALAQHPGKRRRDPAALGRLPEERPRAGDLRAPTI